MEKHRTTTQQQQKRKTYYITLTFICDITDAEEHFRSHVIRIACIVAIVRNLVEMVFFGRQYKFDHIAHLCRKLSPFREKNWSEIGWARPFCGSASSAAWTPNQSFQLWQLWQRKVLVIYASYDKWK